MSLLCLYSNFFQAWLISWHCLMANLLEFGFFKLCSTLTLSFDELTWVLILSNFLYLDVVFLRACLSSTFFKLFSTLTSSFGELAWIQLLSSFALPWHHLLVSLLEFNFFQALLYLDVIFWRACLSSTSFKLCFTLTSFFGEFAWVGTFALLWSVIFWTSSF